MLRTPRSELRANTKTMRRKGRSTPSPTAQRYTPAHSKPHEKKEMEVPTRSGLVPRSSFDAPWKSLRCGERRFTSGSFERILSAARDKRLERRTAIAKTARTRNISIVQGGKSRANAPRKPHKTIPVPSVARSATTAGAVRAIGAPVTLRTKTLFRTSPSLPGEIVIESPEVKIAAFIPVGTETFSTLR